MSKEQYPEIFGGERMKEKEGKPKVEITEPLKMIKFNIGDLLSAMGLRIDFLRARGPYEFAMDDRIAQLYQREAMAQGFAYILRYIQQNSGVPGVRV